MTSTDLTNRIATLLPPEHPWGQKVIHLTTVDSTNSYAKKLAQQGASEGTVVIADGQTGGRGRLGRQFSSPAGQGLYFSLILRPDCPPTELMHLTCAVGLAASDAVSSAAGITPGIKWTNDLVLGNRKLGGILTELSIDPTSGLVSHAIIGIGINCTQETEDFSPQIRQIATSLHLSGRDTETGALAAALIDSLYQMRQRLLSEKEPLMERFSRRCVTIGRNISILQGEQVRHGKALAIDREGALLVQLEDGRQDRIACGEVSIRGMYGYL